jgi:hypothetical protein
MFNYRLAFFHIAAAAIFSPFSPPPAAFATFSKPLPFLPISLPAFAFLTISDFFSLLSPAEGF